MSYLGRRHIRGVLRGDLAISATCPVRNAGHGLHHFGHGACSRGGVTLVAWDRRFFDPILVPGRKPLVTLRDAAHYIAKHPKAEHDAEEWQAAMEALLLVAEHGGPTMFARNV
jgi:hypothetical protein